MCLCAPAIGTRVAGRWSASTSEDTGCSLLDPTRGRRSAFGCARREAAPSGSLNPNAPAATVVGEEAEEADPPTARATRPASRPDQMWIVPGDPATGLAT